MANNYDLHFNPNREYQPGWNPYQTNPVHGAGYIGFAGSNVPSPEVLLYIKHINFNLSKEAEPSKKFPDIRALDCYWVSGSPLFARSYCSLPVATDWEYTIPESLLPLKDPERRYFCEGQEGTGGPLDSAGSVVTRPTLPLANAEPNYYEKMKPNQDPYWQGRIIPVYLYGGWSRGYREDLVQGDLNYYHSLGSDFVGWTCTRVASIMDDNIHWMAHTLSLAQLDHNECKVKAVVRGHSVTQRGWWMQRANSFGQASGPKIEITASAEPSTFFVRTDQNHTIEDILGDSEKVAVTGFTTGVFNVGSATGGNTGTVIVQENTVPTNEANGNTNGTQEDMARYFPIRRRIYEESSRNSISVEWSNLEIDPNIINPTRLMGQQWFESLWETAPFLPSEFCNGGSEREMKCVRFTSRTSGAPGWTTISGGTVTARISTTDEDGQPIPQELVMMSDFAH